MNTSCKSLFYSRIIYFWKFMVKTLKSWPIFISKYKNKCWEIKRSMIADIFIVATLCCCNIKVNYLLVNISSFFKCCNEWSNVLKSSSSYQLWSRILQKSVVNLRKLISLLFYWWNFCNLSYLISACFSYFFFFVLS